MPHHRTVMRSLALVALVACTAPAKGTDDGKLKPKRPIPAQTSELAVAVTDDVALNGVALGGRPMVTDVIAVLGKPSRSWDQGGANKVHTWDKLGVVVYEPYDGRCISLTFPFKAMAQSFTPATLFGGTFTVDGHAITPKTSLATVNKWPGATSPYTNASVVFDKDDIHVFTQSEQAPAGSLDLVEISFWQRGTGEQPVESVDAGEQSCRGGDPTICVRLAIEAQVGFGGSRNPTLSFGYAKLGCEAGGAFACTMLGNAYGAGFGTPKSLENARSAWQRACKLGDPGGCARAKTN
jgi:hypothetical protein